MRGEGLDPLISRQPYPMKRHSFFPLLAGCGLALAADTPAPVPEVVAPTAPVVETLSETRRRLGGIEFDVTTREISLPASVNMEREPIEYVLVHENGKVHESLLKTAVKPFDLNVVLLLLHYTPMADFYGDTGTAKPLSAVPQAHRAEILIRFTPATAGATPQTIPATQWIKDASTGNPTTPEPWVYTGSEVIEEGAYAAEQDGVHIALYRDPRCVLNTARSGSDEDDRWRPASAVPKGTAVTVIIRPSTPPL
jgi:hypothetical protein